MNTPWQERCKQIQEFHTFKVKEKGKHINGGKGGKVGGWSKNDTARALGLSSGYVSEMLRLASLLSQFPGKLSVCNKDDAVRFMMEMGR